MKFINQTLTVLGEVIGDPQIEKKCFKISLRTGDEIEVCVGPETGYSVLNNLDGLDNNRVPEPQENYKKESLEYKMAKYIRKGDRIYVKGIYQEHEGKTHFYATRIKLMHHQPRQFLFEQHTHWWLSQINVMADEWLQDLFGDSRNYSASDFASLYRTNLNIYGDKTDDNVQCMATLSRLIYGLSSAYLLLGDRRYLDAAAAGVDFQRTAFRSLSHDGRTIIWSYGRRKLVHGNLTLIASENSDDKGMIPLYEQIYALAGLSQFYRITGDGEVLDDIKRTINAFNIHFLDDKKGSNFPGTGGFFSHIDPVTMQPDSDTLDKNKMQKNWNSIGDHIPAYLINVILALEPLPINAGDEIKEFLGSCKKMLDEITNMIIEHFPDKESVFVNERFDGQWKPVHDWNWQKNRAIVGHNLKIAWNLTRVANYYLCQNKADVAKHILTVTEKLGTDMIEAGLDLIRGGCFDAVERNPQNGQPVQFVWGNHKDFWQQEQGILAYLILYGYTKNSLYLDYYRDICAWWNTFQLDRENRGVYFRVSDHGEPFIEGRGMAGYDIAGYHAFELNYLAHIYIRTYVACAGKASSDDPDFCLYFRPSVKSNFQTLNVLPDFFKNDALEITGIKVNGKAREYVVPNKFQIPIEPEDKGHEICVEFRSKVCNQRGKSDD